MTGPLGSFGVEVLIAGVVIALAGVFLTPMRSVVLRAVRVRLRWRARRSAAAPAPDAAAATTATATATPPLDPGPAARPRSMQAQKAPLPADLQGVDYKEHEALFARTLLTAQKTAEDLVRNAEIEAQAIIARAEAAAAETARAGRKNASDIIQKAQQDADLIVASAKQKATAWLALLQAEADKLAAEAHQAFRGAQHTVEQNVASLAARFERRMAEWEADPWERQRAAAAGNGTADPRAPIDAEKSDPATVG